MTDRALADLDRRFRKLYSRTGRPSIPPEQLLRALLLQVLAALRAALPGDGAEEDQKALVDLNDLETTLYRAVDRARWSYRFGSGGI